MRQVCYVCGILFGIKEPYENDQETHGLCGECYEMEMNRLKKEIGRRRILSGDPENVPSLEEEREKFLKRVELWKPLGGDL